MKVNDGRENADYYRKMAWKFNELNRRYKQVLEFYANEDHYTVRDGERIKGIFTDQGEKARQVLERKGD